MSGAALCSLDRAVDATYCAAQYTNDLFFYDCIAKCVAIKLKTISRNEGSVNDKRHTGALYKMDRKVKMAQNVVFLRMRLINSQESY